MDTGTRGQVKEQAAVIIGLHRLSIAVLQWSGEQGTVHDDRHGYSITQKGKAMTPKRTLSESARVLVELGRQLRAEKKIPLDALKAFDKLLATYGNAVKGVYQTTGDDDLVDDEMRHGRKGAYEKMVGRLQARERKGNP